MPGLEKAHVYPRDQHPVSRKLISNQALKVMKQLQAAGFAAYLVGGAVRDMLLGQRPKDFDVATNATPEDIRRIFRNSRIIGRRFRIVHVFFGQEIIEVTTFRGHHDSSDELDKHHSASNDQGMLLRDNVFGTIEEDALRRDFTINALYYSCEDFCIYDFTQGVSDIRNGLLRLIGDPAQRYREDPVRILRAVRFAGKLGFELESETREAIAAQAPLLEKVSPARLFDEMLKLLCTGYGQQSLQQLLKHNLLGYLIHNSELISHNPAALKLATLALGNSDRRLHEGKSITPTFILAALLWPRLQRELAAQKAARLPPLPALHSATQTVMLEQNRVASIPKRMQLGIRDIWELQQRLEQRHGSRAIKSLQHPRFRAGYDFLLLREQCGETTGELGSWWTDIQTLAPEEQLAMAEAQPAANAGKKRRPRRRKPASAG